MLRVVKAEEVLVWYFHCELDMGNFQVAQSVLWLCLVLLSTSPCAAFNFPFLVVSNDGIVRRFHVLRASAEEEVQGSPGEGVPSSSSTTDSDLSATGGMSPTLLSRISQGSGYDPGRGDRGGDWVGDRRVDPKQDSPSPLEEVSRGANAKPVVVF